MSPIVEELRQSLTAGTADPETLTAALAEIVELRRRNDDLEELLLMIVRTGWPWDADGEPNEIHRTCRDGYVAAMVEARKLLGLDHLSMITRTEPRT